jgi:putative membrane protein
MSDGGDGTGVKLPTERQRRMLLALTTEWQTATELAEVAGIPVKGVGTVLLALRNRGLAERLDGGSHRYVWRRALPSDGSGSRAAVGTGRWGMRIVEPQSFPGSASVSPSPGGAMSRIRHRTLAALATASVIATPAAAWADGNQGGSGQPPAPTIPAPGPVGAQAFVNQATHGNAFEIVSSQLAQQRSGTARVRRIAQRLIGDHTQAQQQLAAVAVQLGLQVPPTILNAEQTAILSQLASLHGRAFNEAYLKAQVVAHEQAIALFVAFASDDAHPRPLRILAIQTLPNLGEHLGGVRIALRRARRHHG